MRNTLHPAGFHGEGKKSAFFEGWYVKLISADRSARLALIPGVFLGPTADSPHEAFVQVLDGISGRSWYLPFDRSDFTADSTRFDTRVGTNHFSDTGVRVDLAEPALSGEVGFSFPLDPWPVSRRNPGAMGWYAWVPFMECYHGVVSFGHDLTGSLTFEGRTLDFTGGRGYIEKDWGKGFPEGYIWMHSNTFSDPSLSLMASNAIIPWLRGSFAGLLIGLRTQDTLHRFASYTGAKRESLRITDDEVELVTDAKDGSRLVLTAQRRGGAFLHAPIRTQMHKRVEETLDATIAVELMDSRGRKILEDVGECAGLEVHGDTSRLMDMD